MKHYRYTRQGKVTARCLYLSTSLVLYKQNLARYNKIPKIVSFHLNIFLAFRIFLVIETLDFELFIALHLSLWHWFCKMCFESFS